MTDQFKQFNYYYWGPLLWRSKLPESVCDDFLKRGQALTNPLNSDLASLIDNVKVFDSDNDRQFLVNILQPYLHSFLEFAKEWYKKPSNTNLPNLELVKYWINFQRATEFNPEHTHTGDFSFVFYVNIPDELKKEHYEYVGTSSGPGAITFRYGEDNSWASSTHAFLPEKGDLFIFPAKLAHSVYPFRCDGTRISISGNFKIIE